MKDNTNFKFQYCATGCQSTFGICSDIIKRDAAPLLVDIRPHRLSMTKVMVSQTTILNTSMTTNIYSATHALQ
jgi:hypothetical protein